MIHTHNRFSLTIVTFATYIATCTSKASNKCSSSDLPLKLHGMGDYKTSRKLGYAATLKTAPAFTFSKRREIVSGDSKLGQVPRARQMPDSGHDNCTFLQMILGQGRGSTALRWTCRARVSSWVAAHAWLTLALQHLPRLTMRQQRASCSNLRPATHLERSLSLVRFYTPGRGNNAHCD